MRYVQRRIIMADPNWNNGHYYGKTFPVVGMQHAQELGTISYRCGPEWQSRFGNKRANINKTPDFCPDFLIETYLDKQVIHYFLFNVFLCSANRVKNFVQVMILTHYCTFLK